jgi:hypothetical protein
MAGMADDDAVYLISIALMDAAENGTPRSFIAALASRLRCPVVVADHLWVACGVIRRVRQRGRVEMSLS